MSNISKRLEGLISLYRQLEILRYDVEKQSLPYNQSDGYKNDLIKLCVEFCVNFHKIIDKSRVHLHYLFNTDDTKPHYNFSATSKKIIDNMNLKNKYDPFMILIRHYLNNVENDSCFGQIRDSNLRNLDSHDYPNLNISLIKQDDNLIPDLKLILKVNDKELNVSEVFDGASRLIKRSLNTLHNMQRIFNVTDNFQYNNSRSDRRYGLSYLPTKCVGIHYENNKLNTVEVNIIYESDLTDDRYRLWVEQSSYDHVCLYYYDNYKGSNTDILTFLRQNIMINKHRKLLVDYHYNECKFDSCEVDYELLSSSGKIPNNHYDNYTLLVLLKNIDDYINILSANSEFSLKPFLDKFIIDYINEYNNDPELSLRLPQLVNHFIDYYIGKKVSYQELLTLLERCRIPLKNNVNTILYGFAHLINETGDPNNEFSKYTKEISSSLTETDRSNLYSDIRQKFSKVGECDKIKEKYF